MQKLHLAKIIITNDKEPIINGGLLIDESKIINVGKKEDFGNSLYQAEVIDHGESLICPSFINLHTHLVYSNAKEINGDYGLFPWLEDLVDLISTWSKKDYIQSVQLGINQVLSTGTTFIVENTPNNISIEGIAKSPLKALIGLEVFGSEESEAGKIFLKNQLNLNDLKNKFKTLDFTSSPHAPYDISIPLWKELITWSCETNKLLLTHLEESPEEKSWWQNKSGKGIGFWKKIDKLKPKLKYWKRYNSGIDFLNKNDLLTKNLLATHLCQATKDELKILKEKNIQLVHCPRSNFFLKSRIADLKIWDELGFLWGLGTDSIASNQNLDLLEEARFTMNQQAEVYDYKILAQDAFKAITLNPAKILNKQFEIGILGKNYCADFLIYNIKEKPGCTYKDPYELVILNIDNKKDLKEVWINGKKAWLTKELLHKI